MKEIIINGISFYTWLPEENPELFVKIRDEAHRKNRTNPDLVQVNWNTWRDKKDLMDSLPDERAGTALKADCAVTIRAKGA